MTKETYRIRGMTDKQWDELMRKLDQRIKEEQQALIQREKIFKEIL